MRTDGEATRARILHAAGREFAEHGLAGARVDRIAAAASASKERLYAYFGDKRSLFVAVLSNHMAELTGSMPLTADDLPGFVGRIFDFAAEHPEHFRMLDWARLGGDFDLLPAVPPEILARDFEAITDAQKRGTVDPGWDPSELVPMLFAIASTSASAAALVGTVDVRGDARTARRAAAVRAAAKLVAP